MSHLNGGLALAGSDLKEAGVAVGIAVAAAEGGVIHRAEFGAGLLNLGALSLALHGDLGLGQAGLGVKIALIAVGGAVRAAHGAVFHGAGHVAVGALALVGHSDGLLGQAGAHLESAGVGVGVSVGATDRGIHGRAGLGALGSLGQAGTAVGDVDGGLAGAHLGAQLALVGVGAVIRATDRRVHLGAHLRALRGLHAGELRAGGGEALLGLGQAHRVGGTVSRGARIINAHVLGTGGSEALLGLSHATGASDAGGGGTNKL